MIKVTGHIFFMDHVIHIYKFIYEYDEVIVYTFVSTICVELVHTLATSREKSAVDFTYITAKPATLNEANIMAEIISGDG